MTAAEAVAQLTKGQHHELELDTRVASSPRRDSCHKQRYPRYQVHPSTARKRASTGACPHRVLIGMRLQRLLPVGFLDLFLSHIPIPIQAQDQIGLLPGKANHDTVCLAGGVARRPRPRLRRALPVNSTGPILSPRGSVGGERSLSP